MASTARALYDFFSGFGLPAYTSDTVPSDEDVRHITYPMKDPEWNQPTTMYCEVHDRSRSNEFILGVADSIIAEIGQGLVISCEGGFIKLQLENPVVQILTDGDFRRAYINMSMNAYHMPGV